MAAKDVNDVGGFAGGDEEPLPFSEDEKARGVMEAALQRMKRGDLAAEKLLEWLGQRLTSSTPTPRARSLSEVLNVAFDMMDARAEKREKPITTPWPDFNEQLPGGGFWPGCHVLVSGTGVGKTTLALQLALHAAQTGAVVVYAGLELEDSQIVLRLAAELAQLSWSRAYTGEASPEDRAAIRAVGGQLSELPVYLEAGDPMGWPASRLQLAAENARAAHPEKPILIVLDFLQLVGTEEEAGRQDLRERIGRAAYVARDVAKRFGATVLLISSVSRAAYGSVSGFDAFDSPGIDAALKGSIVTERFMRTPDALVGLGKESGEIEFAADTVTVAISLPKKEMKRTVVFATAKVRAGSPSWCSLIFDGSRFKADESHGRDVITDAKAHSDAKPPRKNKPQSPPNEGRRPVSAPGASKRNYSTGDDDDEDVDA